jgi:hypothetical protein
VTDTAGFETVVEVGQSVLDDILKAAYASSTTSGFPRSVDLAPGTAIGPYVLADGVVNVREEGLGVAPDQPAQTLVISSVVDAQVKPQSPPVPSLALISATADVRVAVGIRAFSTAGGAPAVGLALGALARSGVSVTLRNDPIGAVTIDTVRDYVHARWVDGTIPHQQTLQNVSVGVFSADAFIEFFDDPVDASHRIEVTQPGPGMLVVSFPFHLRLSDAQPPPLRSPFGVTGRVEVAAPLAITPGQVRLDLPAGSSTVVGMTGAPGIEGSNYTFDQAAAGVAGIDLQGLVQMQITQRVQAFIAAIGPVIVDVPTVDQLQQLAGDALHPRLRAMDNLSVWTPEAGSTLSLRDVTPRVLTDGVAVALNRENGADPTRLVTSFIPAGRRFAVGISGAKVLALIDQQIHRPEDEGGFGPDFPHTPKTFPDVGGHEVKVTRLGVSLTSGAIHLEGDATVVDAIAGSIDVDVGFHADVGLAWEDGPEGTQRLRAVLLGSGASLGVLAWIIAIVLGLVTFGIVGGIIAAVVIAVVDGVATSVGTAIARDQVSGQVVGIGAFPQTLDGIGTVDSRFADPVDIAPDGVVFSG